MSLIDIVLGGLHLLDTGQFLALGFLLGRSEGLVVAAIHGHLFWKGASDLKDRDSGPGGLRILGRCGVCAIIGHEATLSTRLMDQGDLDAVELVHRNRTVLRQVVDIHLPSPWYEVVPDEASCLHFPIVHGAIAQADHQHAIRQVAALDQGLQLGRPVLVAVRQLVAWRSGLPGLPLPLLCVFCYLEPAHRVCSDADGVSAMVRSSTFLVC